jgi:hypothetical protein
VTENIPACTSVNNGQILVITDGYGMGPTISITVVQASGNILGSATNLVFYGAHSSVTLHCNGATTNWTLN